MLQKIRDNTQGFLSKIFIGLIVAVFGLFGVESIIGTFLVTPQVLKVNDSEIQLAEIDQLTQQKIQQYLNSQGPDADLSGFDERSFRVGAINELVQRELLRQSVRNSGMAVSSVAIDRRILATPDFQVDGVYNDSRATILLQSMGYTPAGYRATLIEDTLVNQVVAAYTTSGFVTNNDLERVAALLEQKRSFCYLGVPLDTESSAANIADADIAAYYADNEDRFMEEEKVKIAYVELNRNDIFDEVTVSEEQVRARYQEEVALYQARTERRAAHILLEVSDPSAQEEILGRANELKSRIDAGEEFAALAAEFSDDTGSAEDGGDVGYTSGDSFVPEFETALQALEVGQVSEPVRTEFGYHLIKLLEVSATDIEPFESRREDLERALKAAEVDRLFLARSEELGNMAFESLDLEEPARSLGLPLQESDWFGRSGGTGVTAMRGVIDASFGSEALEERLNSQLIQVDSDRVVVIHVLDHTLPHLLPLEEVRDEIATLLRFEAMQEQARMLGETVATSVRAGQNIDSMLDAQGLSWIQVDAADRETLDVHPLILQQAFAMQEPVDGAVQVQGFNLDTGAYIVVELQSVEAGSLESLTPEEANGLGNFIRQQFGALDFVGFLTSLENRAEISGRDLVLPAEF